MAPDHYTANVEIKNLPANTNRIIDALCKLTGKYKHQIIRDALIEYANNHRADVIKMMGGHDPGGT